MWPHARSAFSRRIHLSGKGEVAKSIRLSPIPNRAQVRSKGIEKIRLPISWRGLSVQEEAIEYWKANIRGTKDTPSSVYIEQMKLPLVLEMDRELGRKTIFTPYGIRFGPKDPLGAKLLEVARPVSWSQSWSRSSRWIRWTVYYLLLLTSVFCFSREKVPIIGLWQFNCIQHWLSERIIQEDFNSRDEAIQMFQDALLPYDHPLVQRVRSILGRVVRASGLEHVDWDFQIITAPEVVNVAVTPSGQVLLFSGILDIVNSDDELAAVLGHEIAHILAHHSAQHLSTICLIGAISPPLIPCGILGGIGLLGAIQLLPFWLPILGVAGIYYAFSRDRESEADYIGLILMADAGFDPSAAASMWRKMNIIEKRELRELKRQHPGIDEASLQEGHYMSTHPHTALRIRENEKWAPEVLQIVGKSALAPSLIAKPIGDLITSRRNWKQFVKIRDQNRN